MTECFIVCLCTGEFDDYTEEPIRVFTDQKKAQKFIADKEAKMSKRALRSVSHTIKPVEFDSDP